MPNYYGNTSIGPDTKPNYDYATQHENMRGDMDPYFEPNDVNPSNLLRKLGGKYLGGLAAGAIIPGKKIKNVIQGKITPNKMSSYNIGSEPSPYAYGHIDDLPLNNKGSYTSFLNPASGKMAYAEGSHIHHPLQDELVDQVPDIMDENRFARLRRIAYQGAGGEKGVTHIVPPYFSPNRGVAFASDQEDRAIESIIKMLKAKGLDAPGEEFQSRKFWKLNDLGQ
jgi:hypothetical protein